VDIDNVKEELARHGGIIVHCSRPGRNGEFGEPKPLYPDDLKQTIRDLAIGGVRPVSCSVVWPKHQDTFGDVGIVVCPRTLSDIVEMHTGDAGYSEELGGLGNPPSLKGLADTFAHSEGHNEWVLTAADTLGLFVISEHSIEVARKIDLPDGLTEDERALYGEPIMACSISLEEIAADFPSLPIFGFVAGELVKLVLARTTT